MEVQLLGTLDYKKVEKLLSEKITNSKEREELLAELKQLERQRRSEIVSSAARLSRFPGNVLEVIGLSEEKTLDQNTKYASRIIKMGHDSISDHDYLIFALQDVTAVVEQTIIEERYSSFTIKSRREVDFSKTGFYVPDFHDKNGKLLSCNQELQEAYQEHMQMLFNAYGVLEKLGIPIEDARFVLPYCFHSNIMMGLDAHTLKDLIIRLTKRKDANITELRELGEKLYEIAKENVPYIIPEIDRTVSQPLDPVEDYLDKTIPNRSYQVIASPKLLAYSQNVDDTIIISAFMRRYQYPEEKARKIYEQACKEVPDFKKTLLKKIAFESDGQELTQVNFEFQIPISFAVLTHLTRHRTHHILVPDFVPNIDLEQYKVPPKIAKNPLAKQILTDAFALNSKIYHELKDKYGVREEDLVYFTMSGNTVNVITNMDGKTAQHILSLRECNKTQWETRDVANAIHKEISSLDTASSYANILGPSCETQGICPEGKECCGKIYQITKNNPKK